MEACSAPPCGQGLIQAAAPAAHRRDERARRSLRMFLFERAAPARVIGMVNFSNFVRGAFHACHLGCALDERAQGRGLMTEALALAIAHVFGELNFHRIMANYMPRNRRSARLLQRLGFRIEGRARQYLLIAGRWEDHVLTSRVNTDWRL
jgi:ribosomal-protein-alanine N-acetyltransferase